MFPRLIGRGSFDTFINTVQTGLTMVLFTIGYEGLSVRQFFTRLRRNAVEVLIDVRQTTNSRKSGFSKNQLERAAQRRGMDYLHLWKLGTPTELRTYLNNGGSFEKFCSRYGAHMESNLEEIRRILTIARQKNACVMCYERDANECHRQVVADKVASLSRKKIRIINL